MIFSSLFGYGLRHSLSYDPKSKPGTLRLWSSYCGSILRPDPIKNGHNALVEFLAMLFKSGSIYESIHVDFAIGNDNDLFSILAAIKMIKGGRDYSFKNYAGRLISFSRAKADAEAREIVLVKIRHKPEVGIMTQQEIDEFEIITRRVLAKLKYTDGEITEKVEHVMAQSPTYKDENSQEPLL